MNSLLRKVYLHRANFYARKILPHLRENEKMLDIGAGSGYLGEILSRKVKVTLIDIVDYNQTRLPLSIYDGKKLPYRDSSFDVGIIVAVLHHTPNPEKFLQEVRRVCKRIIIVEEVYSTILGRIFIDGWEWFWNKTSGISTFYNFHSTEEWKDIFDNIGMYISHYEKFSSTLKTLRMNLFVLDRKK